MLALVLCSLSRVMRIGSYPSKDQALRGSIHLCRRSWRAGHVTMAVLLNLLKAGLVLKSCTTRGQAAPPPPNGTSLKEAATRGLADQFRGREVTSLRTSLLVNSSGRSSSAIPKFGNRNPHKLLSLTKHPSPTSLKIAVFIPPQPTEILPTGAS